jgi:hypothetical protein
MKNSAVDSGDGNVAFAKICPHEFSEEEKHEY